MTARRVLKPIAHSRHSSQQQTLKRRQQRAHHSGFSRRLAHSCRNSTACYSGLSKTTCHAHLAATLPRPLNNHLLHPLNNEFLRHPSPIHGSPPLSPLLPRFGASASSSSKNTTQLLHNPTMPKASECEMESAKVGASKTFLPRTTTSHLHLLAV